MKTKLKAGVLVLLIAALGTVAAYIGLGAYGGSTQQVGPFTIHLQASLGSGRTELLLAPLGTVSAHTNPAPLNINARLELIDFQQLTKHVQQLGVERYSTQLQTRLAEVLPQLVMRTLGISILAAMLAGAVATRLLWPLRPWRLSLFAAGGNGLLVGLAMGVSLYSFSPAPLLVEPKYTGALTYAPKVIDISHQAVKQLEAFGQETTVAINNVVELYAELNEDVRPENGIDILHISDVHLNTQGMKLARSLSRVLEVDAIIDTGDIAHLDLPGEELTAAAEIRKISAPYYFVRGNHDSDYVADYIEAMETTTVLDGDYTQIQTLSLYGKGLYDQRLPTARLPDAGHASYLAIVESLGTQVVADIREQDSPPDIVAVHDKRMALELAGTVPLVISGHMHKSDIEIVDGTIFLEVGTTGGSGPNIISDSLGAPLVANVLHFDSSGQLLSYDTYTYHLIGEHANTFSVEPHIIDQVEATLPSPSPSISNSP